MRLSLVIHVVGLVVRVFGLMFMAPLVVALIYGEYPDAIGFAVVTVLTSAIGHLMRQAGGHHAEDESAQDERDRDDAGIGEPTDVRDHFWKLGPGRRIDGRDDHPHGFQFLP